MKLINIEIQKLEVIQYLRINRLLKNIHQYFRPYHIAKIHPPLSGHELYELIFYFFVNLHTIILHNGRYFGTRRYIPNRADRVETYKP